MTADHRLELRATGPGGYGTALSAGLGVSPFVTGGVADVGGFGWGFPACAPAQVTTKEGGQLTAAGQWFALRRKD